MFKFFKKNRKQPKDLKEVLDYLKKLEKNYREITQELAEFKKECQKDLQKIGIVRFNPFKEIGGDQSFSMAVLDANNDGFVITSHYGRESNRVYLKPINHGQSGYQLSAEERQAVEKAIAKDGK